MNTAIAIFVKTPGLSPVKTRLAAGIGQIAAEKFYLLSLKAIQETLKNIEVNSYWAVGEEEGLANPLWQDFHSLHTGEGNLGQRQYHVYETLLKNHERVLLIGADAPQISKTVIEQAINALKSNDFVAGPARDGGYYLFGGRKSTKQEVWASVPWSTDMTLHRLDAALPEKSFHLGYLTDVDTVDDLMCIETEMPVLLNTEQKQLIKWINNL